MLNLIKFIIIRYFPGKRSHKCGQNKLSLMPYLKLKTRYAQNVQGVKGKVDSFIYLFSCFPLIKSTEYRIFFSYLVSKINGR